MYLRKQGPGEVTAADIDLPAGVEMHNPELHIATLDEQGQARDRADRRARPRLRPGRARTRAPDQPIGVIPVDSIYSPVLRVTYKVERTRVEQRTDFDKLILDVETNGSIEPSAALRQAAEL